LFPFLVLFGAHILSFYEWKIVQQLLGDNSDMTCVSIDKSTCNIYVKRYNFCVFSFTQFFAILVIRLHNRVLTTNIYRGLFSPFYFFCILSPFSWLTFFPSFFGPFPFSTKRPLIIVATLCVNKDVYILGLNPCSYLGSAVSSLSGIRGKRIFDAFRAQGMRLMAASVVLFLLLNNMWKL